MCISCFKLLRAPNTKIATAEAQDKTRQDKTIITDAGTKMSLCPYLSYLKTITIFNYLIMKNVIDRHGAGHTLDFLFLTN